MAYHSEVAQKEKTIAILGGDPRFSIVMEQLREYGYTVLSCGLGEKKEYDFHQPVKYIILPIPGLAEDGMIKPNYSNKSIQISQQWVQELEPGTTILIGKAPNYLQQWCQQENVTLIEYLYNELYLVANAIPTAEGAICMAMEQMDHTICKSKCIVYGFGRCGKALAVRLHALGAQVVVVARNERDLDLAVGLGLQGVTYQNVLPYLSEADCIYNTVPSLVVSQEIIACLKQDCLILDLASAPGGTDFQFCEQQGIRAVLAANLPGKYFPKTAGLLLADTLTQYIQCQTSPSVDS